MSNLDPQYHRERERRCREMAKLASDPDVRRRHEELAALHANRAALSGGVDNFTGELSAN